MSAEPKTLNAKQIQVLEWIRNGCPDGVYSGGYEHRISARVLERRGLVKIRGRGDTWVAELTEEGREWKDEAKEPNRSLSEVECQAGSADPSSALAVGGESGQGGELPAEESDEDQLMRRVMNEGSVLLPEDPEVVKRYERIVRSSLHSALRPKGKCLEMHHTGRWGQGPQQVDFVEYFDDRVELKPVPVPDQVKKYHQSIKALLSNKEWSYVSDEHLPRAARILQAIADEAERRGMKVISAEEALKNAPQHLRRKLRSVPLRVQDADVVYSLEIREIAAPGAKKLPLRARNEKKTLPAWKEQRGWEFTSTGKLELIVDGPGTRYTGDRYKDAKTSTLEEKLPRVLASFEIYRLKREWHAQERARAEAERLQRQNDAREVATARYFDTKRWEHFVRRSEQWSAVDQHREFLKKAIASVTESFTSDKDQILAELRYVESRIDEYDPLLNPRMLIPGIPDPKEEDLKPYMPNELKLLFSDFS